MELDIKGFELVCRVIEILASIFKIFITFILGISALVLYKIFELPKSKERWTTSAILVESFLLCGDRLGSLHLYYIDQENKAPSSSLLKLHGVRGISMILYLKGQILSAGRDGSIKTTRIFNNTLSLISANKLQMDWVASIVHTNLFGTAVLGFHDVNFVIWSVAERKSLLQINCGGGHRSWDCIINEKDDILVLGFIRNKRVLRFKEQLSKLYQKPLLKGFHTKTINSGCILPIQANHSLMILTGSEDTSLRLLKVTDSFLKIDSVLNSHISSVRSVFTLTFSDGIYVFSAGGRGQMKVWKVTMLEEGEFETSEISSHMLNQNFTGKRPWQELLPRSDPETRYMDISASKHNESCILVMAACSDGLLRIFGFDTISNGLELKGMFEYHKHCILKVLSIEWKTMLICVTMATDGKIAFWNVNKLLQSSLNTVYKPEVHKIHSSGINSCSFVKRNNKLILTTGSDDASICVNVFTFNDELRHLLLTWGKNDLHTCQITGIHMTEDYIITASLDRKVSLLHWRMKDNILSVNVISQFFSFIPDIHGLVVNKCSRGQLKICVFGIGIQVIEVFLDNCLEN